MTENKKASQLRKTSRSNHLLHHSTSIADFQHYGRKSVHFLDFLRALFKVPRGTPESLYCIPVQHQEQILLVCVVLSAAISYMPKGRWCFHGSLEFSS